MLKLLSFTIAIFLGFSCLKNTASNQKKMEAIIQEIIDKKSQNQADFEAILGVKLTQKATRASQYFDNLEAKGDKNAAFENVELRLSIPNPGATNGSIITFYFAENSAFSKDKIRLKYGVAVELGIARPEDVSQTNYLKIKRPGYYIAYQYKGKSEACSGVVLNFDSPKNTEDNQIGIKKMQDRVYEDNPGFRCELTINAKSVDNVETLLMISNETNQDLYLWQKKLPSNHFFDECVVIQNLDSDENETYKGDLLQRNSPIEERYIVAVNAKEKIVLKSNFSSCFNLKKGTKYRVKYNTWMPLLKADTSQTATQVYQYLEKTKSTLPVYFLIESEWVEFEF